MRETPEPSWPPDSQSARLPEELHERVRADGLLGEDRPVVAMLSGGRDSVCLLAVAVAVRGAAQVRALHVNYGLRGEDSDADERHCAALCERLGVAFELVRVRREERERARARAQGNLQAWARELRYREAERFAREIEVGGREGEMEAGEIDGEIDVSKRTLHARAYACARARRKIETLIATGHTASDQVETILYRLAASPGRRALLGMSPREGRIVRPLLQVTREQTASYCRARGLPWREDASNDEPRYARARVRNLLVPALRAVHPAAQRSVLRTAQLLREEAELLDALVADELAGGREIVVGRLAELHPALARLVVVRLAEGAAGDYVPQAGMRVGEILALGARGGDGEVHVGGNVAARIAGGMLEMVVLPPRGSPPA